MTVVALISGGLDSTLAYHWCRRHGFDCRPVLFRNPFVKAPRLAVEGVKELELGDEFIEIIRQPQHGYGKNINPCIDCRILMLKKARDYMVETGARFIVTGEVLGQRPMSQFRNTLLLIDREAGVEGLVVRPLSGKLLPPTEPEKEESVPREWLLDFEGRSRRRQMELAAAYGVKDYSQPAGGCLLTERNFAVKLREEFALNPRVLPADIELLKVGRHFRFDAKTRIIVGRNESENGCLEKMAQTGDRLLEVKGFGSPVALFRGNVSFLNEAALMTKRYSDGRNEPAVTVLCRRRQTDGEETSEMTV